MDEQQMSQSRKAPFGKAVKNMIINLLILLVVLSLGFGLAAYLNKPAVLSAGIGKEIVLEPGQKVILAGESLEIRFIEVVNDSRCPEGAACIWAGEVSSRIEIDFQGQKKGMVLTQSGSNEATAMYVGYKMAFSVQPYPKLGQTIKPKDYRLHLVVAK